MEIEFVGAAGTVTGSMHLVRTRHATVLLDCGLYQGRRQESFARNRHLPVSAPDVDAVVLSHAHIDHSGALPLLCKNGFEGPIYATHATRDLCSVMLRDAAMIQAADARHLNKQIARGDLDSDPVEPLYSDEDALGAIERFISLPYHQKVPVAPGVTLTFYDAGHVLGSALTALDVEENHRTRRLVFTGDLGRRNMPILKDPEVVPGADLLITESTYGDRLHDPIAKMDDDLAEVISRTVKRGGKVIIPAFALERAQELVFALKDLRKKGALPKVPVYIDSPLTVKITEIFKLHPECFDTETRALLRGHDSPFDFEGLTYLDEVAESKAVSNDPSPAVILAASGMCEAGRVLHHLRAGVEDPANTVLIVGFQAQHTLGRRLVEKRARVRIFGVERERRCEVVVLNGFSAHADQKDLLDYAGQLRASGEVSQVALVHGEPKAQKVLSGLLQAGGFDKVTIPAPGDRMKG
ncbi:MAG: MBL fold metallo-hydrolase [Deltaproteobacteria bacterium]|nr:MBL fold metallo-hydrolase [Deltaproteobacteria bacterium]